jgi:tRNA threonylcarbamoyladenosine modification (KEOPS) complex Cgi121 subunit
MAESDEQKRAAPSKQIHAAIDRIEDGDMAVLYVGDDEKTQIDIPLSLLPDGVSDGDHLRITVSIDKASQDAAASRVKSLQEKLTQAGGTQDQKDFKL